MRIFCVFEVEEQDRGEDAGCLPSGKSPGFDTILLSILVVSSEWKDLYRWMPSLLRGQA